MVEDYSIILGVNVAGIEVSVFGVMLALTLAIFLIVRKMNPALAMFTGVFVGAIVGGANLPQMVDIVILGGRQVVGANVRILAGGFLVGALIETGAAETIARGIVKGLGEKRAIFAIALSAMIVTGAGVFITVALLIVSPIALSVAYRANISKFAAILAISGGAKAGNVISPNPNTLAAAESFGLPLSEVMLNPIGDVLGIRVIDSANLPMDPFFVLPIGAVVGLLVMGKGGQITEFATKGVLRMAPIMLMVFGAGAIGGLITVSVFPEMIEHALYSMGIPTAFLAPLSSTIFSSVTGSTTAGIIIGGESFGATILAAGVPALAGAVMLHAGGGFLDAVPHSSGFLATQQGMKCTMAERMTVMPLEAVVGGVMTLTSVGMYLLGFWG